MYGINTHSFVLPKTVVATLYVQDEDEGSNGELHYGLSGEDSDDFTLSATVGGQVSILVGSSALNFEGISSYDLLLTAIDGGSPVMSASVNIAIQVVDENDNPPVFKIPLYNQVVRENAAVGMPVLTVTATDDDQNSNITYSLKSSQNFSQFTIDHQTGVISVHQPLDYETDKVYSFNVLAYDQNHTASCMVIIEIEDINDNRPLFICASNTTCQNSTFTVTENEPPRTITTFMATDADTNSNAVSFYIGGGDSGSLFQVDLLGTLMFTATLDREEKDQYVFTVLAVDNGDPPLTGTMYVEVLVEDVNDNGPETGDQVVYVFLYHGILYQMQLGRVVAHDPDVINNHEFQIISSSSADVFTVDRNGELESNVAIGPGDYQLTVQVTDKLYDSTVLSGTSLVSVKVRSIEEAELSNSFVMQFSEATPNEFVSRSFVPFAFTVSELLAQVAPDFTELVIFSVTHSPYKQDAVDVALYASTSSAGYLHTDLVQHVIHSNRETIEAEAGLSIDTEEVTPCVQEPYSIYGLCQSTVLFNAGSSLLGTNETTSLLGLDKNWSVWCACSVGPTASFCTATEPCDSLPYPSCTEGSDSLACADDCNPNPCLNSGTCVDQLPGYYCQCPEGFAGPNCELVSATFTGNSYALFPSLPLVASGRVSLDFITEQTSGLLLYIGRFDQDSDALTLSIIDGYLTLMASLGGGVEKIVTIIIDDFTVNNQEWISALISYSTEVR